MVRSRGRSAAIVVAAILVPSGIGAAQPPTPSDQAVREMTAFMEAWIVDEDMSKAMGYFDTSERAFAVVPRHIWDPAQAAAGLAVAGHTADFPREGLQHEGHLQRDIRVGYWLMLNTLWPAAIVDAALQDLLVVDEDVTAFLRDELKVQYVISDAGFTVFVADEPVEIDSFDAGYGDVATALLSEEGGPVLAMIADFRYKRQVNPGPFVSFWTEELVASGVTEWRIQALGAFPLLGGY